MADVLLTHSNHLYFDRKQTRKMQPYPPLQTLIAAAALREEGLETALFDATLNPPEEGFYAALDQHRPRLVAVCEDNFNYLTKMCLARNRELAFSMCRAAKARGLPVLVNGSDASDHAGEYLAQGADFIIIGEVEKTLIETVARLLRSPQAGTERQPPGRVAEGIRGLAYLEPNSRQVRRTVPREVSEDLDRIPPPAWDLIDASQYREAWLSAHGYFCLNMVSSRGCPYRCNWCAKPIHGQNYHFRSPSLVADEMLYLKTTFQPDRLWFADDIFALSPRWTEEFAEAVDARRAQLPFQMQSRCDLTTRDTVAALRRAGCAEVWMGVESGSQRVLDAMEKGLRVERVYQARENLRRHGIRACYFLQFGYPGETWIDIQSTVRLVRETKPDDIGVSVAYPLPGTKFYELVKAQLGCKTNWLDSDDLAMMFQGAYTSEFYKALRDALHLEVDIAQKRKSVSSREQLRLLWRQVEQLEKTCSNPNPTVLPNPAPVWTCC